MSAEFIIVISAIGIIVFGTFAHTYGANRKRSDILPQLQERRNICKYHFADLLNYCLDQYHFEYMNIVSDEKCTIEENGKVCECPCEYLIIPKQKEEMKSNVVS